MSSAAMAHLLQLGRPGAAPRLPATAEAATPTPPRTVRDRIGLADVSPDDDHAILPRAEVAAVHQAGRASWQISTDQPQPLVIGLFIRDVAGVPSGNNWLPPTSPTVPRAGDQAPEAAGLQWDDWWNQALREERQADNRNWPPDLSSWWTPPAFFLVDPTRLRVSRCGARAPGDRRRELLRRRPLEQRPPSRAWRDNAQHRWCTVRDKASQKHGTCPGAENSAVPPADHRDPSPGTADLAAPS